MNRRSIAGLLWIVLLLGLPSCGSGEAIQEVETTSQATTKKKPVASPVEADPEKATHSEIYSVEAIEVELSAGEVMLQIAEDGEGYRITVAKPIQLGEECAENFSQIAPSPCTTEYRYMDRDFVENRDKRAVTQLPVEMLSVTYGEDVYTYGGDYSRKKFDPGETVDMIRGVDYHIYKNGEMYAELNRSTPSDYVAEYVQMMVSGGTIYTVADTGLNDDAVLYVGGRSLGKEEVMDAPFVYPRGVVDISGQTYAVMQAGKHRMENGEPRVEWAHGILAPLSPEDEKLGYEGIALEGQPDGAVTSDGTLGYYMVGTQLWGTDGENSFLLCELMTVGIPPEEGVRQLLCLQDGRIIALTASGLYLLTEDGGKSGNAGSYTIGTCADYVDDTLKFYVANYNRANRGYSFTVKQYDSISDMNLALLSGEVALIVGSDILALRNYADKGYLVDLEEVVPELFREELLIQSVVEASHWQGGCYFLPRVFSVGGGLNLAESVMPREQLPETMEAWYTYLGENMPWFHKRGVKKDAFRNLAYRLDEWVDWDDGSCEFTDGRYAALLEYCNTASRDIDEVDAVYASLDDRFCADYLYSLGGLTGGNCEEAMKTYPDQYDPNDEEIIHTLPIPSRVHRGYSADAVQNYFGVANVRTTMEAAGDFMRFCFTQDRVEEFPDWRQAYYRIPWYETGYSIRVDETEDYLQHIAQNWIGGEIMVKETWKLIHAVDHLCYDTQNALYQVMEEEALRYFSGEITAEKAAEYTQNRISIYLAEQG